VYGNANGLNVARGVVGPWPCSQCGEVTQCTDIGRDTNYVFCRNPSCDYERIIDKRRQVIKEHDGTFWKFDAAGNKTRIRAR
jgi:hypothetical protein